MTQIKGDRNRKSAMLQFKQQSRLRSKHLLHFLLHHLLMQLGRLLVSYWKDWRRRSESNWRIKVLQTSALPLGYAAGKASIKYERRKDEVKNFGGWKRVAFILHPSAFILKLVERETRFELATSTLARSHSTTELLPLTETIRENKFYRLRFSCQAYLWARILLFRFVGTPRRRNGDRL